MSDREQTQNPYRRNESIQVIAFSKPLTLHNNECFMYRILFVSSSRTLMLLVHPIYGGALFTELPTHFMEVHVTSISYVFHWPVYFYQLPPNWRFGLFGDLRPWPLQINGTPPNLKPPSHQFGCKPPNYIHKEGGHSSVPTGNRLRPFLGAIPSSAKLL